MRINFTDIHPKFKLNNKSYSKKTLLDLAFNYTKEGLPYEKEIGDFLLDWLSSHSEINIQTSGSTGSPKTITFPKQALVRSALNTELFFNLKPSQSAFHCLPTKYIAGKLMLVRALILGLELDIAEPKSKPEINLSKFYDFCPLVPLQLENVLAKLHQFGTIIVGGAPLNSKLLSEIKTSQTSIYETFGMAETLTHFALKKLNNPHSNQQFKIINGVTIKANKNNCLSVFVEGITPHTIQTHDMVQIHSEKHFTWLGRSDHVINVGGIKINPEQIENKLNSLIKPKFFIFGKENLKLGTQVALLIEGTDFEINSNLFHNLPKFEVPKTYQFVPQFLKTNAGKIKRLETLKYYKII